MKTVSGPTPIFFSEKPADSLKELKESPEYAFQCLQQLVSKLFVRGELTRFVIVRNMCKLQINSTMHSSIIFILYKYLHREEAAAYVYERSKWDTKHGLKHSWEDSRGTTPEAGSSSSSSSEKPSKADKGKLFTVKSDS